MAKKLKGSGGGRKAAQKGAGYERFAAKEISLWLTNDSHENAVWRSAGSGSMATMQAKAGDLPEAHVGDLIPVMSEANGFFEIFAVECKRVHALQWRTLFDPSKRCNIREFWKQAVNQSQGKRPLLLVREDNGVDLIAAESVVLERVTHSTMIVSLDGMSVSIAPLEDVLNTVSPEDFIGAAK